MKRKLHILLAVGIGLMASVGWLHADVRPAIFTDLSQAETGKPIIFNVGTATGDTASIPTVRIKFSLVGESNPAELKDMGLKYWEEGKWNDWTVKDGGYFFGPDEGFSLANLISPILMTPETAGTYTYKLEILDMGQSSKVLVEKEFKVVVGETADVISGVDAADADTTYSTPNVYAAFNGNKWDGIDIETYAQFPNKKTWRGPYTFIYGNGEKTTITEADGKTKIAIGSGSNEIFLDPTKSKIVVLGGKKGDTVESTEITMNSGTISMLLGGGYGVIGDNKELSGNAAKVTGTSTIVMTGGTVTNSLFGGGLYYNKTKEVNISLSGTASVGVPGNWVICGGFESGCTNTTAYGEFSQSSNTVETATLKINGGTYFLIAIGGTDGAKGYVQTATANIENATIKGGILGNGSNGRSDKVTGTIAGCKFEGKNMEIAAINRGVVKDIALTFDGCDFSNATNLYANIGATYKWGYNYNGSSATVEGVPGSVSFTFNNCVNTPTLGVSDGLANANVTVTGAKAKIAKFEWDKEKYHTAFTINADKTWTFNDGLAMSSDVTLTKTGTLEYGNSFEANVATADELEAAVALGADVINLADATYELSETLALTKSVVLQGTDTTKCIIEGAIGIESASKDAIDVVISGVKFDYTPTAKNDKNTRCVPVIEVHKGNVNLQVNNCLVNNNTVGTAGRSAADFKYLQNVFQMDSLAGGSMTIKNCEINLNAGNQIAVLTEAENSTVLLQNTKIQTAKDEKGNPKGDSDIGIFPHNNGVVVTMDNSTIELKNHYGIYMWSGDNAGIDEKLIEGLKVYLKNKSSISAYGAIRVRYTKDSYLSITEGSTLTGSTFNAKGGANDFGALVMQGNIGAVVDIEDSNIGTAFGKENVAPMIPILFNNGYGPEKGTIINLKGSTIIRTQSNEIAPYMVKYAQNPGNEVTFPDPDSLKSYVVIAEGAPVKFLDETGKDCIIIRDHADKSFRNAAVSVASALYAGVYPVAKHGDVVLATDTTMAKALLSLNNANYQKAYTIPDSIIIECKDGYLVTGEKAANTFANNVDDKAVFYLKQTETEFTTVAAGNNHVKITTDKTWDNTNNANRSVEIAANTTLTINVAMPLDTVFMAEGAQLVANAAVTAKAVQLAYGVEKTWKAFGFPFASPSVTNLKGEAVNTTSQDAATGLWTAGIATNAPTFTVTAANATPATSCIIAADKDSTILVTTKGGTLISLSSQPEPSAPIVTKTGETVNFKIVSNPNVYSIELTQTAYVLSEDGKTFDRMVNPTISAFQSFVLADEVTTGTLRSLRVDDTPTGNEIVPTDGYYVQTGKGFITIRTSESVQVVVVDMLGRVYYNARINDGAQINLPAGIYAVNRQKVIVK